MTRKTYNILAKSIKELRESGFTSGAMVSRLVDKFAIILNENLKKEFVNYDEAKFFNKIYGKK